VTTLRKLGRTAVWGLPLGLGAARAAQQDLTGIVDNLIQAFCPLIRFVAGPMVWIAIVVVFAIGIILLVAGGRGAIRYMIVSLVTAILFMVGNQWLQARASSGGAGNQFTQCIKGSTAD